MVEKPIKSSLTLTPGAPMEGGEAAKQVAAILQGLLIQDYDVLSKYVEIKQTKKGNSFEIRLRTTDETIARVFTQIVITDEKYVKTVALSNRQGDLTTISFTNVKESAEGFFGSE
jgi:predicted RNA-binding protein with PIN domain